jgi:hypothetical protein
MFWNKKNTLIVLALALALFADVANADYTFGTPTNIGYGTSPSVSTDGLSLYIDANPSYGGYGDYDIWVYTREDVHNDWSGPVNLGPPINSSFLDGNPDISADGLTLFFDTDRPGGQGVRDLWYSTRDKPDDDWSEPKNLGPTVNGLYYDGQASISGDGLSLYFTSDRDWDRDIYVSTRTTIHDDWSEPENLGPIVNSPSNDSGPDISSDGLKLFFDSERPGGYGMRDIWLTTRVTTEDDWGIPVNLGPIVNTSYYDHTSGISADGSILYFYSNRPDPGLRQVPIIPIVDFNGDENIDTDDLLIMIDNWESSESLCDIGPTPFGDGIVDIEDLIVFMEYWEKENMPEEPEEE